MVVRLCIVLLGFALSPSASAQFAVSYGSGGTVVPTASALAPDGSIWVAGYFRETLTLGSDRLVSAGGDDAFVAVFEPDGQVRRAFRFGGTEPDRALGIAIAPDGSVCVGGGFERSMDVDPGPGTVTLSGIQSNVGDVAAGFLVRYTADGDIVHARAFVGRTGETRVRDVAVDSDGGCTVVGNFIGSLDLDTVTLQSQGADALVAHFDPDGTTQFAIRLGSTGFERGVAVDRGPDGRVCATGAFVGNVDFDPAGGGTLSSNSFASFVACYTADGEFIYAQALTGADGASDIAVDASGQAVVVGNAFGSFEVDGTQVGSIGGGDAFLVGFDASGTLRYGHMLGGPGFDVANDVGVDEAGDVYVSGTFEQTADFDPGSGDASVASRGETDVFLARYAADGSFEDLRVGGGSSFDIQSALTVVTGGEALIGGSYRGTATFDLGVSNETLNSSGIQNAFLVRTRIGAAVSTGPEVEDGGVRVTASPNPTRGPLAVTLRQRSTGMATVTLIDALGRRVAILHEGLLATGDHTIAFDAATLPAGVYIIRVVTPAGVASRMVTVAR
ncbi:MAG: T9SS type A sorting domain-containing protein [Bacteroidota bacterium]